MASNFTFFTCMCGCTCQLELHVQQVQSVICNSCQTACSHIWPLCVQLPNNVTHFTLTFNHIIQSHVMTMNETPWSGGQDKFLHVCPKWSQINIEIWMVTDIHHLSQQRQQNSDIMKHIPHGYSIPQDIAMLYVAFRWQSWITVVSWCAFVYLFDFQ